MRYHDITKNDMMNGEGLRVVLWVSGCSHNCDGCHNPVTHDPNDGLTFDERAKQEIFDQLSQPYIAGITLSGGDPLYKDNRNDILALIEEINEKYPNKTIWLYTGYTLDGLKNMKRDETYNAIQKILDNIDVLVEGRFIRDRCYKYNPQVDAKNWVGSDNQNIIRMKDRAQ